MMTIHKGTCQICGRSQKLPGGVLSKHGYTTRWGFFEKVCPGSGHLPFEVSADMIERCRDSAAASAVEARQQAAQYRAGKLDDRLRNSRYYACNEKDRAEMLRRARETNAECLDQHAAKLEDYVRRQNDLLANWAPAPLKEVT